MEKTLQALRLIPVWFIRQYQRWLSPLIGPSCRFHPSCSQYTIEAIQRRGFFIGSYLAVKRIGKCHPFHPGGVDHVPEKPSKKHE